MKMIIEEKWIDKEKDIGIVKKGIEFATSKMTEVKLTYSYKVGGKDEGKE